MGLIKIKIRGCILEYKRNAVYVFFFKFGLIFIYLYLFEN